MTRSKYQLGMTLSTCGISSGGSRAMLKPKLKIFWLLSLCEGRGNSGYI